MADDRTLADAPPDLPDPDRTLNVMQQFLSHHLENAKAKGTVLGLSGGVDSAVVAATAVRALGTDRVKALFMPTTSSPPEDHADVLQLCGQLGIELIELPLPPVLDQYQSSMTDASIPPSNFAMANLQSRIRAAMLYTVALTENRLVLGTGNKTELMLGYFTKFGDAAADVNPIADLYKKHVWQLGRCLELPDKIVDKPPSAGLWPGQTDEEELGFTYAEADAYLWFRERFYTVGAAANASGVSLEVANRIEQKCATSEHKRRGTIVLKLGRRTPTLDWRLPLS